MNDEPGSDKPVSDEPDDEPEQFRERLLAFVDADRLPALPLHPCPYLPALDAQRRAFRAPQLDGETYHELMDRGFRRSGDVFYAMDCPACRRCVPLRVPVETFVPSKSQRRVWRRNQDVVVRVRRPEFSEAAFAMYGRYLRSQHGGDVDETAEQFRSSLYAHVVDTVEVTYSVGDQLLAISLLDVCARSVSAVYHFFEPEHRARSLGVFSVMAEIEWTRRLRVPHYYLGYWIEGAPTMAYKAAYRPHEVLIDGEWRAG